MLHVITVVIFISFSTYCCEDRTCFMSLYGLYSNFKGNTLKGIILDMKRILRELLVQFHKYIALVTVIFFHNNNVFFFYQLDLVI